MHQPIPRTVGKPFWPTQCNPEVPTSAYPPLQDDKRCDIVIIGAGITGALIAYELSGLGATILVLDRGMIGHASTSASTSLILYELDKPLHELAALIGREAAEQVYVATVDGVNRIKRIGHELLERHGLDTGTRRRNSLYVANDSAEGRMLEHEHLIRRKCGIDVDFLDARMIESRFGFSRPAALLSHVAAEADSLTLTRHLLQIAACEGVLIYESTAVARWECDSPNRIRLQTESGLHVECDHLIIATGYSGDAHLPANFAQPSTTYVTISEPIPNLPEIWPEHNLIWETGYPYAYLRTTADDRILIGGADDDTLGLAVARQLMHKQRTLQEKLHTFIPDLQFKSCSAWASTFISTPDSLPYIGEMPGLPNAYFALCYGGNDMTFAAVAAKLIAQRVLKRSSFPSFYSLNRPVLAGR